MAEVAGRQSIGPRAVELHDDLVAVIDEPRLRGGSALGDRLADPAIENVVPPIPYRR